MCRRGWLAVLMLNLVLVALLAAPAFAGPVRPAGSRGTVLVPDHFLRSWDPVTIFFDRDLGPAKGGPEDRPERWVRFTPAHPGAFTWLDSRTLQLRPAEAWPALTRFRFQLEGRTTELVTLLPAPVETWPWDGAEGLERVERVELRFPEPVDVKALARAVTLELRPLPGVGSESSRWLDADDFTVQPLERRGRDEPAGYLLALAKPIPLGSKVVVHLKLSLDEGAPESLAKVTFSTLEPFRPTQFGCPGSQVPVTPSGSRFTPEQALSCPASEAALVVDFSATPKELGTLEARNLVRISPPVDNLSYQLIGRRLRVTGDFARDTRYRLDLVPTPITSEQGQTLDLAASNQVYLFFPARETYLRWTTGAGVAERRGPQEVPLSGRGQDQVDLRIQKVDPLDRSFWPFPESPVVVDESRRPPGPGEEKPRWTEVQSHPTTEDLAAYVHQLGSPPLSKLIPLPLARTGTAASFGLDLAGLLATVAGPERPGTYLLGLRSLDASSTRAWMRLTVTDLSLTTTEEPRRAVFWVTSLATGAAVAGARVRVEGAVDQAGAKDVRGVRWETLFEGSTDARGQLAWTAPGAVTGRSVRVRRIVVAKDDDLLVLDPAGAPDYYSDGAWLSSRRPWLQWTQEQLGERGPEVRTIAHVFTERPVYRPEEPVHVKGYVRSLDDRRLSPLSGKGLLTVQGPGNVSFRYPLEVAANGSFYHRFQEDKLPTGTYRALFQWKADGEAFGEVSFRVEAYRLPTFEVQLWSAEKVPLDRPFEVKLTATYYAGGRVTERPVAWRVTQFPYAWAPAARPGWFFSSDGRFSPAGRFESTPTLSRQDSTNAEGGAAIQLDPTLEPTAQPRTYVVEATVTGADDQTVTNTRRVVAVPPFLVGVKVPRYLERAAEIHPEVLVLGPEEKELPGVALTVRLIHRQWHSHLRASDFSDGVARYVTELVDEKVAEKMVDSGAGPLSVALPTPEAGVYLVEVEARDKLGRAQVVSVDLFVGGDEAVAWAKPGAGVFKVAADKKSYKPGETATLVLESPFQSARALAIVEAPEGVRYEWLEVAGGKATYQLPLSGGWTPRLPVHFLLMRGRIAGTRPVPGNRTDLGKPATLGATAWLEIEPLDRRVEVKLAHPAQALPGKEITVEITLSDPAGKPLAGEVTLWLVDQAVLALGREQRLDPLPDFLRDVRSYLVARDTRNLVFGLLPFAPEPGGDGGEEAKSLFDRQTVRKNFQPVPFYDPAIAIGPSGKASVKVQLPDNLTNFKLRAKAISGPDRFGFGTGHLEVRLPVIVQPALPRFVRPGDRFVASAVGRIVEGGGGAGRVEARFSGVEPSGPLSRAFEWNIAKPERFDFEVAVPGGAGAGTAPPEVTFQVGVERASDRAGDAFEVRLPVRQDRDEVKLSAVVAVGPGQTVAFPEPREAPRPGTLERRALVTGQDKLLALSAGLDFLLEYPYGCTEQRVSRSRAQLALGKLSSLLREVEEKAELERGVRDSLDWLAQVTKPSGLISFWPGSDGYVWLTAQAVEFEVEAKAAGYGVDDKLLATHLRALEGALRSDYAGFLPGEEWSERAAALRALALAGRFEAAYGDELARQSQFLDLDALSDTVLAFSRAGRGGSPAVPRLVSELWNGVGTQLHQGKEIFAGVKERQSERNRLILPGEVATLGRMVRALAATDAANARLPLVVDGLAELGRGGGWGSTDANAGALLALAEVIKPPFAGAPVARVEAVAGSDKKSLFLDAERPSAFFSSGAAGQATLTLASGPRLAARTETRYVPAADGSQAPPRRDGFVVRREMLVYTSEPPQRTALAEPGRTLSLTVGTVVEDHVEVVNPEDRHYVAVVVPLAAGMEPLNPALATAPPEARTAGRLTLQPSYVAFLDDHVAFYYDSLPKGTYDFYFRTRATVPGTFIQPPAKAEMMYRGEVVGTSAGAKVEVERAPEGK
ncbi:MAG TPA: alpha-2-macroglobulin family protein [Thermoanaerobaculia bacterium]|nr:alpha-2-macroglobulin family protein [Thermoanaerobaculia bacterium]